VFTKVLKTQTSGLTASYAVTLLLAKSKKPFSNGMLVKNCAVEMAKAFRDNNVAEKFQSVSLSHQTVSRRIADMGEQVTNKLTDIIDKCCNFSSCMDESTDQTDTSQLLIFIRATQSDFSTKEELLELCFHGNTKGTDIYESVKKAVQKFGSFDKCSCIVTNGAKAVTGKQNGLAGLLRQNGVNCPLLHCIIHQEALCGKSIKQSYVMKTVVKITNLIRDGNKALSHRKFREFLQQIESSYGDLLLHSEVRWLSAGKCLERFFALISEIPIFLSENVKANTADLENQLHDP
jgi:hypothetical protein